MKPWQIRTPHAFLWFDQRQGAWDDFVRDVLDILPGVRLERNGSYRVPDNALAVITGFIKQYGVKVFKSAWGIKPSKAPTWEEVRAELLAKGEVREKFLGDWPKPYQKDGIANSWRAQGFHLWHATGCLVGETEIKINRGGKTFSIRLDILVARLNGEWEGAGRQWDLDIPTLIQSEEEGLVRLKPILSAFSTGEKEVFRLSAGGRSIVASADHKFLSSKGWVCLEDLAVGDSVAVNSHDRGTDTKRRHPYVIKHCARHPFARRTERVVDEKLAASHRYKVGHVITTWRIEEHRLVAEARLNELGVEEFKARVKSGDHEGLKFINPATHAVHHVDGDVQNNHPSNLLVIRHDDHGVLHGAANKVNVLEKTVFVQVTSIESEGVQATFDLSVDEPNNYIANDFVVHNSGKTFTGMVSATSEEGDIVIVTRAASKLQFAREVARFTKYKAHVLRTDRQRVVKVAVEGRTWWTFYRAKKAQGMSRDEIRDAWVKEKEEKGLDKVDGMWEYVEQQHAKGERAIVVVPWEYLRERYPDVIKLRPGAVVFDEAHRGRNPKRWDVVVLTELPDDPQAAERLMAQQEAEAKKNGGFIKEDEEGRKMFLPTLTTAAAAANLARAARKVILTTATPVANRVRDLWAQLDLAEPNAWGNATSWLNRHCLVPETPVMMGDGTYKPIGEIREGDEVIGWSRRHGKRFLHRTKVIWAGRREAPVVQLKMASGKVVRCTRDHHWLSSWSSRVTKERTYLRTSRWVEYEGGRWVRGIQRLQPLLHAPSDVKHDSVGYKLGYIRGLIDGDGHARIQKDGYEPKTAWGKARRKRNWRSGKPKKYQMTIFSVEREHLDRAEAFAREIGLQTSGVKSHIGPKGWTLGFYSRKAYRRLSCSRGGSPTRSYKAGWLAGMYDAEGSGAVISQHERVNEANLRLLEAWLDELGFSWEAVREGRRDYPVGVRILGGRPELLRFWETTRPAFSRKLDAVFSRNPNFRFGGSAKDKIVSMTPLKGDREVVSIQTEAGNYIADGFGSKNCDRKPGTYGGFDTTGSSHIPELKERLKGRIHIVNKAEAQKFLPDWRRISYYIAPEELTKPTAGFREQMKAAQERGATALLEVQLAKAASMKRKAVLDLIADHVSSGDKVVVFTARKKDVEDLAKAVREHKLVKSKKATIWGSHGGHSTDVRQEIVDDYMAHPGPCVLVGTGQAFGESINLDKTDAALFVMLPYTPEAILQWEGRFVRNSMDRPVIIYYVIAESTIDERVASILLEKLPNVGDIAQDSSVEGASQALSGYNPDETPEEFAASILAELDYD